MSGKLLAASPAPRTNPRLEGHADAERLLLRAQRSGRLPHAWLICGPRGIGKATLAYRFARFVLAQGQAGGQGPAPVEEGGLFGDMPAPRCRGSMNWAFELRSAGGT